MMRSRKRAMGSRWPAPLRSKHGSNNGNRGGDSSSDYRPSPIRPHPLIGGTNRKPATTTHGKTRMQVVASTVR